MKRICFGIAIILFGILLELSINGSLAYISWAIGAIGLAFAATGLVHKEKYAERITVSSWADRYSFPI